MESTTAKIPKFFPFLFLDFDTREAYREFPMRARFLARWVGIPLSSFRIRRRRTARGWHIVVFKQGSQLEYEPLAVVAAQALLGSDWKREGFNLVRALHLNEAPAAWQKIGRWNTLYARKMGALDLGVRDIAPPAVHDSEASNRLTEG